MNDKIYIKPADPDIVLIVGSGNERKEINISELIENGTETKKKEA